MKLPEFHHHQRIKPKNYGLDLARACAVAFVFFSHSLLTLYSSGIPYLWYGVFIGVELFFSLSGFLIGRMLIDLFDHDNVSFEQLANFWTRRWFRTLPLYFVLYFIYYLAYNKWIYPVAFDWRYLLFLQNLTTPPPGFFGESWSLGIEEWFYFLFPLVLFVAYLFKMRFMPVVLSIILAQVTVRWLYPGCMDWGCISVLLHFDAAAYGLIAAYLSKQNFQVTQKMAIYVLLAGALFCVAAAFIKIKSASQVYFLVNGPGTAMIVFALNYYRFSIKIKLVPFISRISYSIYLIHLSGVIIPLAKFTNEGSLLIWLLSAVLTILLATLSYTFIERPFLLIRDRWFPSRQLPASDKKSQNGKTF